MNGPSDPVPAGQLSQPAAQVRGFPSAASRGLWLGVSAGVATASADFFAQWLWLDGLAERHALALSMYALHAAVGAGLGCGAGLLWQGLRRATEARRGGAGWAMWALLLPACLALGHALLSGPSRSIGLPAPLLHAATALASLGLAHALPPLLRRTHRVFTAHPVWGVATLSCLSAAVSKLDQHALPGIYESAHLALSTLAALLGAACAVYLGVAALAKRRGITRLLSLCLPAMLIGGYLVADGSQNVRVALLHPRASHSHSIAYALRGWLQEIDTLRVERSQARLVAQVKQAPGKRTAPVAPSAHVLLITVDALRADRLGAYGYRRGTSPAIDSLASRSILFEHAYSTAPHTSFALSTLFSGRAIRPHARNEELPGATLASTLADAGYHTAAFFTHGIFHTGFDRLGGYADTHFGFDRYDDTLTDSEALTRAALLEMKRTRDRGEPSSLFWVHYFDVHEPYRDERFGTSDTDRYDGEIAHVDEAIGRLLAGARALLERDLVVVLTADHGEAFREHGHVFHGSSLYQEQIHIPLLLSAPGLAGARVARACELSDVTPTIVGLLGLSPAASMRGEDLLASDLDAGGAVARVNEQAAVVAPPYKLIADVRFGSHELYRLDQDPGERKNLSDQHPAIVAKLRAKLDEDADQGNEDDTPPSLALAEGGDRRALPGLRVLARCGGCDHSHRVRAIRALGVLGETQDRDLLRDLYLEGDTCGAEAAVAAGMLGERAVEQALLGLLEATPLDRFVRALRGLEEPSKARVALALARLGNRASVPPLVESLPMLRREHREEAERRVIAALGKLGDPRALPALTARVMDPYVGYLAVLALGELRDPRALSALTRALREGPTADIRDNAAEALGHLGDRRAIPALRAADPSRVDQQRVHLSLKRLHRAATDEAALGPGRRDLDDGPAL